MGETGEAARARVVVARAWPSAVVETATEVVARASVVVARATEAAARASAVVVRLTAREVAVRASAVVERAMEAAARAPAMVMTATEVAARASVEAPDVAGYAVEQQAGAEDGTPQSHTAPAHRRRRGRSQGPTPRPPQNPRHSGSRLARGNG